MDKPSVVAGDAAVDALVRELHEPLGVILGGSTPLGLVRGALSGGAKELPETFSRTMQAHRSSP